MRIIANPTAYTKRDLKVFSPFRTMEQHKSACIRIGKARTYPDSPEQHRLEVHTLSSMVNGLTSLRQKLKKGNHSVHKVDTFGIRGDTPSPRHSLASPFVVNTQKVKEKNDRRRKDGSRPLMNQRMDSWDQYMANQQAGEASRRLQTITAPEVPQRRRTVLTRPGRLSLGSERDENPYDGSRAAQRSVPPTFNKGIPEGHGEPSPDL